MNKLRILTSGESHGRALTAIIDGVPAGLSISPEDINRDLARRQKGFGRGGRMKIETDSAQILSGIRMGKTLGSPISLLIENRDWPNWEEVMGPELRVKSSESNNSGLQTANSKLQPVTRPRPGHADLSGALKYGHRDIRNVLERSSARETAARVAAGAIARRFLAEFNINVIGYVTGIGGVSSKLSAAGGRMDEKELLSLYKLAEASPVRCPYKKAEEEIMRRIEAAMKKGDTLGGVFEIVVTGVPAGLGSYSQWDRKLEARLSFAMMGIQAIKGVEIGTGFEAAERPGSEVMDEIFYRGQKKGKKIETAGGYYRKTNNAGGIEGGMSNGMPVILRAVMKPIPTLKSPLASVDIITKKKFEAAYERSDVCAVPAASVVGEAVTATVIADSFLEKFGGDSMEEIRRNYEGYLRQMREF